MLHSHSTHILHVKYFANIFRVVERSHFSSIFQVFVTMRVLLFRSGSKRFIIHLNLHKFSLRVLRRLSILWYKLGKLNQKQRFLNKPFQTLTSTLLEVQRWEKSVARFRRYIVKFGRKIIRVRVNFMMSTVVTWERIKT